MNGIIFHIHPEYQTAWEWLIFGILLYYLTLKNAREYIFKGNPICMSFLVSMIGDTYPVAANRINEVFYSKHGTSSHHGD